MGPGLGAGTVLQRFPSFPSLTARNPRLEGPDETSPRGSGLSEPFAHWSLC